MSETLPLSGIVDVVVDVSPISNVRSGFNLGLVIGKSTIISAADRVKTYTSLNDMSLNGWAGTEPEYLAATLYFAQSPRPAKIAIGRWDATGTETAVEAATACRTANSEWYAFTVCGATKTEIIALAAYAESAVPSVTHFYTTSDADAKAGTAGNVFDTLKLSSYSRSIGQYSTTAYAAAAIMGYAMGANTGFANSAYTLAYKSEVGVVTEDLLASDVDNIKADNGNVYINRGSTYNVFEPGVMANGVHFDEIINLDILSNDIQTNVMNLLTSVTKIPQTEDGTALIMNSILSALEKARVKGFIAPGVWTAPSITASSGTIETGDVLATGYAILSDSIASQSQADREARVAPPIYALIKLAGAIEHVAINVLVNR